MDTILSNLQTLCSINSKSKINDKFNQEGINQAQQSYLEMFLGLPVEFERKKVSGAGDLVVIKSKLQNPSRPKILLSGHIDTVLVPDDVPFEINGEKVYGSGVADMKGGLIVINEIVKKLNAKGKLVNVDVIVSPEEELALPNHMENIREIAKKYDYIFVFESTLDMFPEAGLDERGLVVSRRGFQQYHLSITAEGGHSGAIINKEKRVNANLICAEFMLELEKLADYEKRITFNSGLIKGGKAVNVLSPICELTFDCRFASLEDYKAADKAVTELVDRLQKQHNSASIKLETQDFFPSMDESEKTLDFTKLICKNSKFETRIERRNGGSEASIFAESNPNAIVLDGFGVRGGAEHTAGEYSYIKSFDDAVEFGCEVLNLV